MIIKIFARSSFALLMIFGICFGSITVNAAQRLDRNITKDQATTISDKLVQYKVIPQSAQKDAQKVIQKMTIEHVMWWANKLHNEGTLPLTHYRQLKLIFGINTEGNSPRFTLVNPNGDSEIKLNSNKSKQLKIEWDSTLPSNNPIFVYLRHEDGPVYELGRVKIGDKSLNAELNPKRITILGNYVVCIDTPVPNTTLSNYSDCSDGYIKITK